MLVDTNVVSELMRRAPNARLSAWAATQERFDLSVISIEEVYYGLGLRKSERLECWFNDFVETYCEVLTRSSPSMQRSNAFGMFSCR